MSSVGTLEWPDYVVLAVFLAISLGIGFYHSLTGGRQRTTEEFIMANRRLGVLPTSLSLFVSFSSAISMLGFTAEMYMYGIQLAIWLPLGYTVSTLLVERLIVPWIFPLKLISINDASWSLLLSKYVLKLLVLHVEMTRNVVLQWVGYLGYFCEHHINWGYLGFIKI